MRSLLYGRLRPGRVGSCSGSLNWRVATLTRPHRAPVSPYILFGRSFRLWAAVPEPDTKQIWRSSSGLSVPGVIALIALASGTVYYASETGLLQPQELLQQRTHGNALETAPSADAGASSLGGKASQSYRADAVAKDSSVKQDFASSAERALETKSPSTAGKAATAWSGMLDSISDAKSALTSIEWSSIPNTITTMILPEWVLSISGYITRLQDQLSMTPGSLAEEIWQEANDPDVNPEILWSASVRVSEELCDDEKEFLRRRRPFTKAALARYLDLEEEDVNPEDIPTIAICGSGGGLRALIAGTGSYMAAHRAGLFDCATYTAGVSGSCWLQTLYYSTVTGCRHDRILKHVKARTDVHVAFPPAALALVTTAPTNKFLLRGIIEKLQTDPDGSFGLVDVYGVLLAARLLVPKGELAVDERDLKLSSQRMYVDGGLQPLPIYTAVRHEIPLDDAAKQADSAKEAVEQVKEVAKAQSWFQWFEFTPYELWCEELHAGIPTWALGRKFDGGSSLHDENGLAWPQLRMPLLMGMWGSAFCATLSHYYQELSYTFNGVVGFESIDRFMDGINDDLIKVHPIDPTVIPNYVTGMKDQLPGTCPESILRASHLQLMDAGMSNNLPIYPLLRPGRDIDIVVAFDSSSCIRSENWLSKVDGYARQRGIKGWPVGIGWPKSAKETQANVEKVESAQAAAKQEAIEKIEQAKDQQQQESAPSPAVTSGPSRDDVDPHDLGYCTVWVGTTEERLSEEEPPPSKKVEADWEILHPSAGITVVYFPLLPNPKVEGIDPETSAFMSTWNSVYTAEQVDQLAALAQANFEEGQEQTKATIRAVYERKKRTREKKEASNKVDRARRKMRLGIVSKKADGDHFS